MMAATQQPEEKQQEKRRNCFREVYLTREDFTALGLLTDEEIDAGQDMLRILSVEDSETPSSASITSYKASGESKGSRVVFNRAAGGDEQKIISELTMEARIYNTMTREPAARYLTLTATKRLRNAEFKTETSDSISISALQSPEDPGRFIIDFVLDGRRLYEGRWQAANFEKFAETLRNMQDVIGQRAMSVTADKSVKMTSSSLPAPAAPAAN